MALDDIVESIHIQHLPLTHPVHAVLFRDVNNATAIRHQLLAGNSDFEYAFVDASVVRTVVSRVHALAAAFRAVSDLLAERLKTRNVHSEIVFAFSPSNNIADSFRRFGISDSTKHLLILKVATNPSISRQSVQDHLLTVVDGKPARFTDTELVQLADLAKICKIYKLPLPPTKTQPDVIKDLEVSILGAMALRGAN
ncbi:MAG: hypothetical protein M1814_004867 [Vezdaea aestivalis]|nr:MAG: hypothetical protein M1814_004867 [Vezdaea aestivalis]